MSRITRIVPTAVLTVAALALVAPAAQAKPYVGPNGGFVGSTGGFVGSTGGPNDVSPIVRSVQASHGDAKIRVVAVTTGDKPLANPVKGSETLGAGLMHASTVPSHIDSQRPVSVPASPSNGFDWTAAAIGAGLGGLLMLGLAAGFGSRRRGQLAA
jgi:hypothetical protein